MFRRLRQPSADAPQDDDLATDAFETADAAPDGPTAVAPDLAALPVIGLTRRRLAGIVSAVLAAWVVFVFAQQVSDAQAATARADQIAAENALQVARVAALERELEQIAAPRYIAQQARGYGLGSEREIPFSLSPDAPPLPPDAPGSAAVRLGADISHTSPLERWLTVLFGPAG